MGGVYETNYLRVDDLMYTGFARQLALAKMGFSSHFQARVSPKLAVPVRRQWSTHCGTRVLQRLGWSRETPPWKFVWVLAWRLELGLARVGKGSPPQILKTEIVSASKHLTGLEWCVEALCKCTQRMQKRRSEKICGAQP